MDRYTFFWRLVEGTDATPLPPGMEACIAPVTDPEDIVIAGRVGFDRTHASDDRPFAVILQEMDDRFNEVIETVNGYAEEYDRLQEQALKDARERIAYLLGVVDKTPPEMV